MTQSVQEIFNPPENGNLPGPEHLQPAQTKLGDDEYRGAAAVELLWERRHLLLKFAIRGLVISTIIAFLIPTYYSSSIQLMPPSPDPSIGLAAMSALNRAGGAGLGLMAGSLFGIRSSGALFIGILRTRSVEDQIIDRFDLRKIYGKSRLADTRKKLEWNTKIAEDRVSGILTITVTDQDRNRAAAMATAYVDELNRRLSEVNTTAAHKERVFLEEQLKLTKQELDQATGKFSQFASKNSAIDIQEQGKAMVEAAAKLQGELIAAQSELKGLEQIYMGRDVRVRAMKARVGELQSQLQKLGGQNGVDEDPTAYPSIRKLPLLGVTYFDLYRQTKIQEAVYEILNQQYQVAKVQEAKELPNARVLDPSDIAEQKAGPFRTLIVFAGLVLSVLGGAVWILGKRRWGNINPRDPRKRVTLDIFSTVRARVIRISSSRAWSPARMLAARFARGKPLPENPGQDLPQAS